MKIYKVKVNGKVYEVELEAVSESNGHIEAPKASETPVVSSGASQVIEAPISGKIIDVKVNVGDKVSKGQVVCIVEAMKLENEVVSGFDGVVKEVKVSKGANVNNKDALIVLG